MTQPRGRFAPTPSGSLHFGSLVAALASYLQTKSNHGLWFVRIDDLDTPRVVKGSTTSILKTLEQLSLNWDGEVLYQSTRVENYQAASEQLNKLGLTYPCSCSRKEIGMKAYAGTCRYGVTNNKPNCSIRVKTENKVTAFEDLLQGKFQQNLSHELGDFIIKRADDIFAYHLATVVDDHYQKITEVVRGLDLIDSTPRQIYLQQLLGYQNINYSHLPLVIDQGGKKLSKSEGDLLQNQPSENAAVLLCRALTFLAQEPPVWLQYESTETCINWALKNWSLSKLIR